MIIITIQNIFVTCFLCFVRWLCMFYCCFYILILLKICIWYVFCFLRCLYRCILILSQLKKLLWVVFFVCFVFCVSSTDLCSLGFILLLIVYFLLLYLDSLQLKSLLTGVFCTRHLQVISVGCWNPFRQCSIMVVIVLLEKVS